MLSDRIGKDDLKNTMKTTDAAENIEEFIQYVATKKQYLDDWQFLHFVIEDPSGELQIGAVENVLEYHIRSDDARLLINSQKNELILFASKLDSNTLSKIEKGVYEKFSSEIVKARLKGFEKDGLEQFSKIIGPYIQPDNAFAQVAYTRMSRASNNIIVLDDDPMVLKQMEQVLSGFGDVVTVQDVEDFYELYKQHAPDLLFLDIHLGRAKGNEILRALKSNIDPYAYVVMISSDTEEQMIEDVREGGAMGFIAKPFVRNLIFQQVIKAPTIVTRT